MLDEGWWLYSLILYFQTPKFCSFIQIIKSEKTRPTVQSKEPRNWMTRQTKLMCFYVFNTEISYYVHIDNTESNGFSHHQTDTLINITLNRVQFIILYHTVHETFNKIWLKLQMFQFGVCAWHRHPTSIISIKLNANMLFFLPSYSFGIKYEFICLNL